MCVCDGSPIAGITSSPTDGELSVYNRMVCDACSCSCVCMETMISL